MNLTAEQLRCPNCGAHLDGGERDAYSCQFCGTTTPRAALVRPQRTPFTGGIDRLWKAVGADFDQDGWFEICGWHRHTLHAIDLIDRTLMWTLGGFTDDHDLFAGPGRVYVATDGELTAINAYTGARVWTLTLPNVREVHDPGHVANGAIWVRTAQDKLVAIDRATGARRTSHSAHDSASLFRTIVGHRIVVNDAYGLRIFDAQSGPVLEVGTEVEKAARDLEAGRMLTEVPASLQSAVVHRGVLYAIVHQHTNVLVAYRVADGSLVARRTLPGRDVDRLLGAVAGAPITGDESRLRREPDGPTWSPTGDDDPQIESATGAGGVLVVHVRRDGPGSDRHSLIGLDASSLTPIWQLDDLGYLISEIVRTDERIVFAIDLGNRQGHELVAIDPASGAMLWSSKVPAETGLQVGGGLVIQTRMGVTLLADTGEMMFPTDARTSSPAGPPATSEPEELPTWGIENAGGLATRAAAGSSKPLVWIAMIVLAVLAMVALVVVKR